jgi:uncharacterized LabA/DUF88 family protein
MAVSIEGSCALAVLIDADNASPLIIEGLLGEVAKLGVASVKRIYGDWTTPNLGSWKSALLVHSIQPIQQFRYTNGKNATDSAMIIDAMDLLYAGALDAFCLVSSDSDFTRLASRLREAGKRVYGFGEKKTPRAFVSACDRFTYTEIFSSPEQPAPAVSKRSGKELAQDTSLVNLFRSAIQSSSDENGWANLSGVGSNMVKQAPDFDPRNYGYQKLSELASAVNLFEVDRKNQSVMIKDPRKK